MSKIMDGYILGVDNTKMYSIITDGKKSYQLDCEYELLGLDKNDIVAEKKFKMFIDENNDVKFEFREDYINENITLEDLKRFKNIK